MIDNMVLSLCNGPILFFSSLNPPCTLSYISVMMTCLSSSMTHMVYGIYHLYIPDVVSKSVTGVIYNRINYSQSVIVSTLLLLSVSRFLFFDGLNVSV